MLSPPPQGDKRRGGWNWRVTPERVRAAIRIDCDNVAAYIGETIREAPQHLTWRPEEIPNAAPPFSLMWLDWKATWLNRDRMGEWGGVLIESRRADDGGWVLDADACWLFNGTAAPSTHLHFCVDPAGAVDVGSIVEERSAFLPPEQLAWYRSQPQFQTDPAYRETVEKLASLLTSGAADVQSAWLWLLPAFLAISFMHCKNVGMEQAPVSQFENRAWKAKHRFPLLRYERVVIDPMKKVLRNEGGSAEHGLKKALHICRGHFATYTEDRPLFGHAVGTFWRAQHLRGVPESGVVVKTYGVKAPRNG